MAALMLAAEAEEGIDVLLLLLLLLDDAGGAVTTSDLPVEYPIDVSVWASESTTPEYTICDVTSSRRHASTTRARTFMPGHGTSPCCCCSCCFTSETVADGSSGSV